MSLVKTADDGNVSIFTKEGVTVYKGKDALLICQRNPNNIVKRYEHGSYRIPLNQDHGQWQQHRPTEEVKRKL